MFKVGKITNYYEKIGMTIVELSGNLTVGDKIKVYKDGECLLTQKVGEIIMNQKNVSYAKSKDVVALVLNEKVQKGSEVFREGRVGIGSRNWT